MQAESGRRLRDTLRRVLRRELQALRRGRRYAVLFSLLLSLPVLMLETVPPAAGGNLLQRLDFIFYDFRFAVTLPDAPPPAAHRIVIVDLDERSLELEGRWPWSREKVARLLERLADLGAVVVGFDIVFSEPERNPAREVLARLPAGQVDRALQQQLQTLAPGMDADRRLADAIAATDVVLAYYLHTETRTRAGRLPAPVLRVGGGAARALSIPETIGYSTSLPVLQEHAAGMGFVSADPDLDGIVRRSPLLLRHGDGLYASFALELARAYLVQPRVDVELASGSGTSFVAGVQVTDHPIRTDAAGRVIVPYRGPRGAYPYLSATDVLQGRADPDLLFNSIVLVGTSAVGLADLRATPLDRNFPGVEVHASMIDAMLNGDFPYRPDWQQGATLTLLAALAILCSLVFPFLGPGLLSLAGVLLGAGLVYGNFHLWQVQRLDLPLASALLLVLLLMTFNLLLGFLRESVQRRRIKGMFDQYVPPAHIESMLGSSERHDSLRGETREMSVLFSDVRGFTAISEHLSAAEIKDLLNTYLTPVTEVIFEFNGTVDKYVGDMVVAFWGAPLHNADHGTDAVRAALKILEVTRELGEELVARGLPRIEVGIGLNSGPMNVGDMGSKYRRAYTVIGDAVNLAARLEGLTRIYGVDLVVGDGTRDAARGIAWRLLDRIRVKGKQEAVRIWQPLAEEARLDPVKQQAVVRYRLALDQYFASNWTVARERFQRLLREAPDREEAALAQVFLERIDRLEREGVEQNWDGSYRFLQK